jgi:hypothetical protein
MNSKKQLQLVERTEKISNQFSTELEKFDKLNNICI